MNDELPDKFLTRDELRNIPPMRPMIGEVLDKGTVAMIAAPPASGKSFLGVDLACCYATGKDWQGHRVDNSLHFPDDRPMTGAAGYVVAEGMGGFKQRVDAWESAWGTNVPNDGFMSWRGAVQLADAVELAALKDAVYRHGIGLLFIDTLARCSVGLEENSAGDMGRVIRAAYYLREAMGPDGTVVLVHHAGKSGTVRGSSALEGGVDQVLRIEREGDHLELSDQKRKDSPELAPIRLRMKPHAGSIVLESGTGQVDHSLAQRLVAAWAAAFSATGQCTKTELRAVADMGEREFYYALNQALKFGMLQATDEKNPRYRRGNGDPTVQSDRC